MESCIFSRHRLLAKTSGFVASDCSQYAVDEHTSIMIEGQAIQVSQCSTHPFLSIILSVISSKDCAKMTRMMASHGTDIELEMPPPPTGSKNRSIGTFG